MQYLGFQSQCSQLLRATALCSLKETQQADGSQRMQLCRQVQTDTGWVWARHARDSPCPAPQQTWTTAPDLPQHWLSSTGIPSAQPGWRMKASHTIGLTTASQKTHSMLLSVQSLQKIPQNTPKPKPTNSKGLGLYFNVMKETDETGKKQIQWC